MEKRRYYGKKIKRTKNLYRRKKTAGQKVLSTVIFVFAASAIAFLGFCIGKPLLDYLGSVGTEKPTEWTPAASYSMRGEDEPQDESVQTAESLITDSSVDAAVQTEQTVGTNQPHTTQTGQAVSSSELTPVSYDALVSVEAPSSALANRSSLSAVLAKAKTGGYNSVVVQLRDRNGYFRYKTTIDDVADTDLITGTMTLDEIMSVFSENGMIPIAEITVLSDDAGCALLTDMSYKCLDAPTVSWLDYSVSPPRRWANPENDATREYFSKIVTELSVAGVDNILLTDLVFPNFQPYDAEYIAGKYFAADRYKMLYNVVKAGKMVEMKASDIIAESYGRTAEILNDTSQLRDNSAAVIISRADLPTDQGYPADAKALVETALSLISKKTGDIPVVPIIDGSGFDDAEKNKIINTLGTLGYESYIIR